MNTVNACVNTDQVPLAAKMGAEAIQDLLKQVDLEAEIALLKEELKTATGQNV